jgi:hypothetical protein
MSENEVKFTFRLFKGKVGDTHGWYWTPAKKDEPFGPFETREKARENLETVVAAFATATTEPVCAVINEEEEGKDG